MIGVGVVVSNRPWKKRAKTSAQLFSPSTKVYGGLTHACAKVLRIRSQAVRRTLTLLEHGKLALIGSAQRSTSLTDTYKQGFGRILVTCRLGTVKGLRELLWIGGSGLLDGTL